MLYKLWEGSWQNDAVLRDKVNGIFADPAKVHAIAHEGKYFSVPGIHLCEPSPQRTPVLYQAGASPRGQNLPVKMQNVCLLQRRLRLRLKSCPVDSSETQRRRA